jgi:erythromycin esterase
MNKKILILLNFLCLINVYSQTDKIDFKKINNINSITEKFNNNLIVGLGEGTHGTKDFNDIRINISKNLIQKQNFTIIAFEQAFGDSYFLNKGINSDQNIKNLMRDNLLSIWQTKEFEDFFLWIREYNLKSKNKIIITGFDVNLLNNSSKVLKERIKNYDNNYLNEINKIDSLSLKIDESWLQSNNPNFEVNMKDLIKFGTEGYLITKKLDSLYSKDLDPIEKIALTNLQLGFQNFYEANNGNYDFDRDYVMASNIEKIQKELNSKIILFAHNAHIANEPTLITGMGKYLKKTYKKNYYALATFSSNGYYSAMTDNIVTKNNDLKSYSLPNPLIDSWEEKLKELSRNDYFIDFRSNISFPKTSLKLRLFGYAPYDESNDKYFTTKPLVVSEIFDGVIFIHNSKASELLQ